MSSRALKLEPGDYYAGHHFPLFATDAEIARGLEKLGLTNIAFHDRTKAASMPIDPHKDPHYTDDWDAWISATYAGQPKTVELQHSEYLDWLVVVNRGKPAEEAKPAPKAPSAYEGFLVVVALYAYYRWFQQS